MTAREEKIASSHARSSRGPARTEGSHDARLWFALLSQFGRKRRPWIVIGALAIVGGGVLVYEFTRERAVRDGEHAPVPAAVAPSVPTTPSWIDGTPLPQGTPQPFAVAVVVDNAPESRPQVGLAAAPLVFEVPVEGRRTRFLAVYPVTADVGRIGPVRSARPYFVGLAEALGVPLVHVGGSSAALALLKGRPHINQYYDPPFVRDHSRVAPFNVFTALSDLRAFVEARGWVGSFPRVLHSSLWPFVDAFPEEITAGEGRDVRIPFSGYDSSFVVEWKYDESMGVYSRRRGGAVVRDADGAEVAARNVVVLSVRSRVLDAIGRLAIPPLEPPIASSYEGFINAGRAVVFRDGKRIDGQWSWEQAPSDGGRFGLRQKRETESGEPEFLPIPLAPGTTWVEVVDWNYE